MKTLRARVVNGRLVVNEPTELPEGTELTLTVAEEDELDDTEREALHAALRRSAQQADRGETRPASETLAKLGK